METSVPSPFLVPFDGSFRVLDAPTTPPRGAPGKRALKEALQHRILRLRDLQRRLYAEDRRSLLMVFQALDAAGKDGTVRAVMSGVNPAGCQVYSFRRPSSEELDHDFLWRTTKALPRRGNIGIFNRSYYEEVLVVRVHPGILQHQRVQVPEDLGALWEQRLAAIEAHEAHLARQGTTVVKFFLHVSADEQRRRLLKRIDDPDRNWKFEGGDVDERRHRPAYLSAFEAALNATSRPHAPWYALPADDKHFMRLQVADVLVRTLEHMDPQYPTVGHDRVAELQTFRQRLESEVVTDVEPPVAP